MRGSERKIMINMKPGAVMRGGQHSKTNKSRKYVIYLNDSLLIRSENLE